MTDAPLPAHRQILSPTDLARRARLLIEDGFGMVWITGELSNFRVPSSGHWYFTLKDDSTQLRAAMFVNRNRYMRMKPKDGMQVLIRGKVTLYEARSDFQIIAEHIEEAGEGALRRAFEALLKKLDAEGLTAVARKRPLPAMPRRIAVITSATGAALQDMLSIWRRRYPLLDVVVLDVAVQGNAAEPQILAALARIPEVQPDLVIITRGGGSLEDLWAFNLESVARALAACPVPTISAIGHEIDTAITDYVADLRAPTPSAAAELSTPHRTELSRQLSGLQFTLASVFQRRLQLRRAGLDLLRSRLVSPFAQLQQWMQRADDLSHRAHLAMGHALKTANRQLVDRSQALMRHHPQHRLDQARDHVNRLQVRHTNSLTQRLRLLNSSLSGLARTLDALSPLHTVARGYAILTDTDGHALTRTSELHPGQQVRARMQDGEASMLVEGVTRAEP
jgi:exodeoxyribonuclease VII large subunit